MCMYRHAAGKRLAVVPNDGDITSPSHLRTLILARPHTAARVFCLIHGTLQPMYARALFEYDPVTDKARHALLPTCLPHIGSCYSLLSSHRMRLVALLCPIFRSQRNGLAGWLASRTSIHGSLGLLRPSARRTPR